MKMDVDLEAVRNKIASTEAEIAQAKKDGDIDSLKFHRDLLLEQTKYLTKLQEEKNLLLGQKAATGMIPPYSSYQYKYCHIFIYIFFICLSEYFSTIYSCFILYSCDVCLIGSLPSMFHIFHHGNLCLIVF